MKTLLTLPLLALCAALAAAPAHADVRVRANIGMVFDNRYHHDHYYPAPGYVAPRVPRGSVIVGAGPGRYWFHGGVWYQPYGPRYRVVTPPVGVVIPLLPPSYVTLTLGGQPYYYANGVYYRPVPEGYAVATPPADTAAPQVQPAPPPPPPKADPIIYPRNGQSPEQLETDRRDCNRWATTQPNAQADSSVFNRAVEACMDGRGYTLK
ncbi:DUF6515 family protein [Roseateles asaccharophilus]|uniref:Glycine zipper family protein n=1 Tax=Roseateles asaccharophilus TaxID=582607 RepID=A0ABU2AF80_9BURK|nr:DUF6515 family protein [Roseateles asaccharophilus]MDR7335263.1 hypothetical protein [Roseateles asaccharophilus]